VDRAGWSYPPGDLRVSDADRDRALCELSEAFQVGRITADELDERSGQALAARTGKELTALLADLPAGPAPMARAATQRAHRVLVTRVAFTAGVAAVCFSAVAAASALSQGPTLHQREFLREMMTRQGLPAHPGIPPSLGFNWGGTITPGAIAVLLVALVVYLGVRLARADRP
jgi:Domain of unknown function (DUF1707)